MFPWLPLGACLLLYCQFYLFKKALLTFLEKTIVTTISDATNFNYIFQ